MTEAEWLVSNDPAPMRTFLAGWGEQPKWSERKKRLFMCACCRRVWSELSDERSRRAIIAAEDYVEGTTSLEKLEAAGEAALRVSAAYWEGGGFERSDPRPLSDAAFNVTVSSDYWGGAPLFVAPDEIILRAVRNRRGEEVAQAAILREIIGNPFQPMAFSQEWRTDTVLSLAQQMYDAREFSAMPILADALQDAGCEDAEILNHCRSGTVHVRGCWVVDLVLEKE
jgi:hypothetical protein